MLCDVYINCSLLIPLGIPKSRFSTKQVSEHQWNKTLHTIAAIGTIAAIACDCGQLRILSAEIRFIHHHLLDGQTSIHPAYDIGSTSPNPNVVLLARFLNHQGPRSFLRIIVRPQKKSHILRKFQQTPGTYPRYPNIQIWENFLHTHLIEGLGYVPGVCSSFLRRMSWAIIMYTVTISPCITHWLKRPKERWFPSNRATHFWARLGAVGEQKLNFLRVISRVK